MKGPRVLRGAVIHSRSPLGEPLPADDERDEIGHAVREAVEVRGEEDPPHGHVEAEAPSEGLPSLLHAAPVAGPPRKEPRYGLLHRTAAADGKFRRPAPDVH